MENIECVLIKINEDLEGDALYERTRKCWKESLNNIKNKKIVFCIFNSKIKEVYEVFNWEECPRDKSMGVQFVGKVSTNFRELINLDVSSMYKKGNANPIMYKDLVDIVQLNNHGKIIIANITWSDNGWTEKFTDNSSNHRYVQKGGLAHECYNFNFESEWNDNYQYGFFQATNQPKLNGNKNIVFFHSQNKIVGVYVNVELGKFDKKIFDDDFDFNLKADKSLSFKFDTFLEMDKEDYLDGKQRIGQVGFNYVEKKSAKNILEDFIDLSSNDLLKEKAKEILNLIENVQFPTVENGEKNMSHSNITQQPLNQILYGPPGTGKTFNTINKAIEIIENRIVDDNENRIELKSKFDEYKENGQIKFVTFHQSYGYEEFVEGIKAISPDDEKNPTNELIYKVEDGIFKDLSNNARPIKAQFNKLNFNWNHGNIFKMSLGGKNDSGILDWCLENNYISMGWGNEIDFSQISAQNWETFRDKSKSLFVDKEPDRFTIQAMYAFKEWMKKDDLIFVSLGNLKIVAIGQVIGDYEYKDSIDEISYSQFRKVKWLFIDKSGISTEKLLTKKLSQQTIYNLDKSYVKKDSLDSLFGDNEQIEDKKYVLIIDEINRGNISKVFGELITLIEDSKRAGNDEAVEIILPYSGEKFSVPKNLYLLGTMNTADRSIALMDTALRRRFHFEEMMPNLDLLKNIKIENIEVYKLLDSINKRIEYLYDRDHTIGHAYFMALENKNNIETLSTIFQNKIIPLLQEYFYDDWEKIRLVLGDNQKEDENLQFIKIKQGYNLKDLFGDKGLDSLDIDDESNIYEINKAAFNNHTSYIKVYEK
jgi:5-methylcytosine-specific restriction enzyme B